jgi:hypothetical protein
MKYFFLSSGWTIGRVWQLGGLWNENAWRRKPEIQMTNLHILEKGEELWLYQVEDAVLMVEVKPISPTEVEPATQTIGQVVLKRLINADQTISRLNTAEAISTSEPSW